MWVSVYMCVFGEGGKEEEKNRGKENGGKEKAKTPIFHEAYNIGSALMNGHY